MIYNNIAQGSPEWHDLRKGRITGSDASDLMFESKETVAYKRLLSRVRAERKYGISQHEIDVRVNNHVTGYETPFKPIAMAYGAMMETEAREHIEEALGVICEEVGFVTHPEMDLFGCSPDGLIFESETGCEIKCPVTLENHYHVSRIKTASDLKKYNKDYYYQVLFCMICTGYPVWIFCSYMPYVTESLYMCTIHIDEVQEDVNLMKLKMELTYKLITNEESKNIK